MAKIVINHIFVINQLTATATEYNEQPGIKFMFIGFNRTFDSIEHQNFREVMEKQGFEGSITETIKRLYEKSMAYIKTDRKGSEFKIGREVKRGDPLSPNSFNCVLEDTFRQLNRERRESRLMENLRYADDIVLIAKNSKELEEVAVKLLDKCRAEAGRSLNTRKTKSQRN